MNDAFCGGAKAAQGRRNSKNPYDSPLTGSYSIYYWMISRFYNHPRSLWNLSAVINGCGFAVSAGLLKEIGGFHTKTLTEDLEFTTQCILRDQKVAWVPDAVFYDESPLQFSPSWKQRRRWSTGVFQCLRLYGPRLLGKLIRERKLLCLDQFLFLTAPLMQILSLVPAALAALLFLLSPGRSTAAFLLLLLLPLLRGTLLSVAVTLLGGSFIVLLEKRPFQKLWKAVLYYWIFLASWIPINVVCLFRRSTTWTEIKHTRSIPLREISSAK